MNLSFNISSLAYFVNAHNYNSYVIMFAANRLKSNLKSAAKEAFLLVWLQETFGRSKFQTIWSGLLSELKTALNSVYDKPRTFRASVRFEYRCRIWETRRCRLCVCTFAVFQLVNFEPPDCPFIHYERFP